MIVEKKLFTSESVSEGHPDKLCDQISDAILDACLKKDKNARVACECFVIKDKLIIGGEITCSAKVDYEQIARDVITNIGYNDDKLGFNGQTCKIEVLVQQQSNDIAMGVDKLGAGDQGIMFGYASNETDGYMPLALVIAHKLVRYATSLRKAGEFKWARPDMKSQVTIDYSDKTNTRIDTILMSVQHDEDYNEVEFKKYILEEIMIPIAKSFHKNVDFKVLINPTGRFVIGGPAADTGLTGRKIIVDTYGGAARHGGGAFSGKDCTKVDRSAAYAARHAAKNIVAAGLATEVEIQLSYAIGIAEPVSIAIMTNGTNAIPPELLLKAVKENFDFTPSGIIKRFNLTKPIFLNLATYGHFGRPDLDSPWEKLDQVEKLKKYLIN